MRVKFKFYKSAEEKKKKKRKKFIKEIEFVKNFCGRPWSQARDWKFPKP